jgi:capsular exopolysaccharide synthesis family protein
LPLALGLAFMVSGLSGVAAWYLLPPSKYKAASKLLVKAQEPHVVFRPTDAQLESSDAYQRYQGTQITLLKSRFVMHAALQRPGISVLSIIKKLEEPEDWLLEQVQALFLPNSEVLEISLAADNPEEAAKVVNAVEDAYMQEVVLYEAKERKLREDKLNKSSRQYSERLKRGREQRRQLASAAGTDDQPTLNLQRQIVMEDEAAVRRELRDVQSRKRRNQSILKLQRPEALQETAASTVSNAEVEKMIEQDPVVSGLRSKLLEMTDRLRSETAHTGRVARKSSMDPGLKALHDEVESLKKQIREKRESIRPDVIRFLQNPQEDGPVGRAADLARKIAEDEELEARLKEELDGLLKKAQSLTTNTLDLQDNKDDLTETQKVADQINHEIEVLRVEQEAPLRIVSKEHAVPPTLKEWKKFALFFGAITIGSFLATLLGVTFLELKASKVDTADEVVVDLGLPLVGSLPMLPHRSRGADGLARQQKDRYWHNLLLESIDATRTMLLHAARNGSHQVVMITSALSGEGKTSLASHLATSLARSGKKTLLIDADLRSPSLHRLFDLTPVPGLSELLRGESTIDEVIATTAVEGLIVISAGKCDFQTHRILSQGGMGELFRRLKGQYDFIIVDSSPILPVADALIIAQQADAVLLSVLTDVSRKTKIFSAYQRLVTLGVRVLGAVVIGGHEGLYGGSYYPSSAHAPELAAPATIEGETAS